MCSSDLSAHVRHVRVAVSHLGLENPEAVEQSASTAHWEQSPLTHVTLALSRTAQSAFVVHGCVQLPSAPQIAEFRKPEEPSYCAYWQLASAMQATHVLLLLSQTPAEHSVEDVHWTHPRVAPAQCLPAPQLDPPSLAK